ncbi:unnamed protein product [Nezara viridula]|uniref:Uncharacterized protein n=1 Tax=Nezara viridula TaxID=85310 RepID=A0A9P0MVD1_NEZVI|nr:unnamed protein product [Nezara viridula]
MSELGRRSARLANGNQPMKPLGVCNSLQSYDRKSIGNCLQKSPNCARKTLFEGNFKENEDYALCKEISSRRENTGKSPVVVPNIKSSNDSHEKKKVKPRRSMLGLRSKTQLSSYNKDSTYTLSKPLLASSPNNAERLGGYRELRKSISTPQLTPFDSDDVDTSAFFNKGISDSTWSVFKSVKKKSVFEPPSTRGSLLPGKARNLVAESDSELKNSNSGTSSYYESTKNRMPRKTLTASVDQEVKLKWLAQKFQMDGSNPHSAEKYTKNMNSDDEYYSENSEVADNSEDYDEDKSNITLTECLSPIEKMNDTDENDLSSANSTDSYIQNETTILNSGKNNLEKIEEENGEREHKEDSSIDENLDDCDEGDRIDIHRIINLFDDLKSEKEEMDSKWSAFIEQREAFEKKWNDFNFLFRAYERNVTSSQKKLTTSNSVQGKSKKVVSTKLRPSFVNPANICLKLPKAQSNSSSSNRYNEKKSNSGNCKTPLSNDKLLRRFRKSTCYTPNSLSIMVDDQAKDIFGS